MCFISATHTLGRTFEENHRRQLSQRRPCSSRKRCHTPPCHVQSTVSWQSSSAIASRDKATNVALDITKKRTVTSQIVHVVSMLHVPIMVVSTSFQSNDVRGAQYSLDLFWENGTHK